jgi:hypothetical protein
MAQGNSLENLNCCINKRTVLTFLKASLTQTSPKLANFGPNRQKTVSENSPSFKT